MEGDAPNRSDGTLLGWRQHHTRYTWLQMDMTRAACVWKGDSNAERGRRTVRDRCPVRTEAREERLGGSVD